MLTPLPRVHISLAFAAIVMLLGGLLTAWRDARQEVVTRVYLPEYSDTVVSELLVSELLGHERHRREFACATDIFFFGDPLHMVPIFHPLEGDLPLP